MIKFTANLNMTGAGGLATDSAGNNAVSVPGQYIGKVKYLNIQNLTDNTLKIFAPHDNTATAYPAIEIGARMQVSLEIAQTIAQGAQFLFANPDPTSYTKTKPISVIWSDESMNWATSFANSFNQAALGTNVNISGPVDGAGNVKVNLAVDGAVVQCDESGKNWASHVFGGVGSFTFKNTPGRVFAMVGSGAIGQQLLDNATACWKAGDYTSGYPIQCATNISVSVTGAGTVYMLYE